MTGTCLISFDRNRYSVMAKAGRRTVQVRAYADRIVVRCEGEVVADHRRFFGRDRTLYDPWHYLPVLATKPGALRNGAPFQDWELPPGLATYNKTDHTFTFRNGSAIQLGYLRHETDVENYQGAEFQLVIFEEVTHFTESQYLYMKSRLRAAGPVRAPAAQ